MAVLGREEKLEERHPSKALEMGDGTVAADLRDVKGEILVSGAIFGALGYPKHLLSAGKYHTGPVGDILEKLKAGG